MSLRKKLDELKALVARVGALSGWRPPADASALVARLRDAECGGCDAGCLMCSPRRALERMSDAELLELVEEQRTLDEQMRSIWGFPRDSAARSVAALACEVLRARGLPVLHDFGGAAVEKRNLQ